MNIIAGNVSMGSDKNKKSQWKNYTYAFELLLALHITNDMWRQLR